MALSSMDDKLLGEKVQNYCSSSEDEDGGNSSAEDDERGDTDKMSRSKGIKGPTFTPASKLNGKTVQTGPKGVIEDWRRYKQLETEKRERDLAEKNELCKKLAMTCKSFKEEQAEIAEEDEELKEDEEFMDWYKQKRILEIQQKYAARWAKIAFGKVYELTCDNFIEAIEGEQKFVTIVIHIYDDKTPACDAVNGCFSVLAEKYKKVKFCRINTMEAKVSHNFIENGLPTIIVYKENIIIGNFVRISDTLGDDFFANDLEAFLNEYGVLPTDHDPPSSES